MGTKRIVQQVLELQDNLDAAPAHGTPVYHSTDSLGHNTHDSLYQRPHNSFGDCIADLIETDGHHTEKMLKFRPLPGADGKGSHTQGIFVEHQTAGIVHQRPVHHQHGNLYSIRLHKTMHLAGKDQHHLVTRTSIFLEVNTETIAAAPYETHHIILVLMGITDGILRQFRGNQTQANPDVTELRGFM